MFQLNHDISEFTSFGIEDRSSINIEECFSARDFEAILEKDLVAIGVGVSGSRSRFTTSGEIDVRNTSQSQLHATYEFPRVILFMDEQILELLEHARRRWKQSVATLLRRR